MAGALQIDLVKGLLLVMLTFLFLVCLKFRRNPKSSCVAVSAECY